LVDVLELLSSNMQIQQFLISLGTTAAKETGERVGKWVVDSIALKIKEAKLFRDDKIKKTEKELNDLISKGKEGSISLAQSFWIDFLTFMFPEREVRIDELNTDLCSYIANRIYVGLAFEQLLLDIGYKLERIRYMTHFEGLQSKMPHYFDLAAMYEQEYFDNLLAARVIDLTVNSPNDFINSLPSVVRDINGGLNHARLRDHDIICIVLSNDLTTRQVTRLRQTIRTVQTSYDVFLPRLVLFTNDELKSLLGCEDKRERGRRTTEKFIEVRPYRGLE